MIQNNGTIALKYFDEFFANHSKRLVCSVFLRSGHIMHGYLELKGARYFCQELHFSREEITGLKSDNISIANWARKQRESWRCLHQMEISPDGKGGVHDSGLTVEDYRLRQEEWLSREIGRMAELQSRLRGGQ